MSRVWSKQYIRQTHIKDINWRQSLPKPLSEYHYCLGGMGGEHRMVEQVEGGVV